MQERWESVCLVADLFSPSWVCALSPSPAFSLRQLQSRAVSPRRSTNAGSPPDLVAYEHAMCSLAPLAVSRRACPCTGCYRTVAWRVQLGLWRGNPILHEWMNGNIALQRRLMQSRRRCPFFTGWPLLVLGGIFSSWNLCWYRQASPTLCWLVILTSPSSDPASFAAGDFTL